MNFGVSQFDVELTVRNVEDDDVAIGDGGDGASACGFRRNMADHQTVRGAGESSVRKQSDGIAEPCADQRGSNGEHFTHARAAFGAFVADDDDIAGFDLVLLDGGESKFFVIENARGAAKTFVVAAGHFNDATFGSEIAFQNDEAAGWFQRRVDFSDDFLVGSFFCDGGFFGDVAAGDGNGVAAEQFRIEQPFGDESSAASRIEIGGDKAAAGFEVGDDGNFRADAVEIVDAERDMRFVGNGEQVQHGSLSSHRWRRRRR